jgi:formamidopyrimidine-DNA glycosylase
MAAGEMHMADLDGGETLVIHLGMSGRIRSCQRPWSQARGLLRQSGAVVGRGKHDHVSSTPTLPPASFLTIDASAVTIVETAALGSHKLFKGLGVEPLSKALDAAYLRKRFETKRRSKPPCWISG